MQPTNRNKIQWKWKPERWWIALILYWFISMVGAGLFARSQTMKGNEAALIILLMLVFCIFCMFTDRGWNIILRIIWIPAIWLFHGILVGPAMLISIGLSGGNAELQHLIDRGGAFIATIPIIVWAMRRSKVFVEPKEEEKDTIGS